MTQTPLHDSPTAVFDVQHCVAGLMQASPHLTRAAVKGRGGERNRQLAAVPASERRWIPSAQRAGPLTDAANCAADTGVGGA